MSYELQETHTGDSPRAMSTRSSLAVFNADSLVEADKRKVQSELEDDFIMWTGAEENPTAQQMKEWLPQLFNAGHGKSLPLGGRPRMYGRLKNEHPAEFGPCDVDKEVAASIKSLKQQRQYYFQRFGDSSVEESEESE